MAEVVSLDLAENKLCTLLNWRGRVFVSQLAGKLVVLCLLCLPLFFLLIHGHSTRPKCHHQQQASDD